MIKIEFSQADITLLQAERHNHPHPRVRQRLETVYLKALGYTHQEIGHIVGISQKTLRGYLRMYQSGGIEALTHLKFYRPVSALETHRATLTVAFTRQPAPTIDEAIVRIERLTGVRRGPDAVRRYLKKIGLKRRKMGQVPAKADPQKQADFLKKTRTAP